MFTGEGKGDLSAFDAKTGERLWVFNCGAGVNAPQLSYAMDGKQYVAVAAGGNSLWGFRQGGGWWFSDWRTSGVPCTISRASLPVVMACKERGT